MTKRSSTAAIAVVAVLSTCAVFLASCCIWLFICSQKRHSKVRVVPKQDLRSDTEKVLTESSDDNNKDGGDVEKSVKAKQSVFHVHQSALTADQLSSSSREGERIEMKDEPPLHNEF